MAVIGDLVGSRRQASRGEVQAALVGALEEANDLVPAVQALEPTIGDKVHAAWAAEEGRALQQAIGSQNLIGETFD